MAARYWEMAPSKSPALRKRLPEFVAKTEACRSVFRLASAAPVRASSEAAAVSPSWRRTRRESGVRAGKIGLQANGFAQSGGGLLEFGLLFQHRAERVVSLSVIGFGVNGGLEFRYGGIQVTLLPESDAEGIGASGCEESMDSALRSSAMASGNLS